MNYVVTYDRMWITDTMRSCDRKWVMNMSLHSCLQATPILGVYTTRLVKYMILHDLHIHVTVCIWSMI